MLSYRGCLTSVRQVIKHWNIDQEGRIPILGEVQLLARQAHEQADLGSPTLNGGLNYKSPSYPTLFSAYILLIEICQLHKACQYWL